MDYTMPNNFRNKVYYNSKIGNEHGIVHRVARKMLNNGCVKGLN